MGFRVALTAFGAGASRHGKICCFGVEFGRPLTKLLQFNQ